MGYWVKATAMLWVITLGACTNDTNSVMEETDVPISFSVEEEILEARTASRNYTSFTSQNFGVSAYWYPEGIISGTGANPQIAINNQKVNYDNGTITLEGNNKYYWVKGAWHFNAYSPWVDPTTSPSMRVSTPTLMYGGYSFEGTVDGDKDYMFADEQVGYYDITAGSNPALSNFSGPVSMKFHHALAKVTLGVRLSDASNGKNTLTLNRVYLSHVFSTGEITFTHNGKVGAEVLTEPSNANKWATTGWDVDETEKKEYPIVDNVAFNDELEHVLENPLFLLPQTIVSQILNVDYTLKIGANTYINHTASIPLNSASIANWSINSHVHYTLTVNSPDASASLTANVQPWEYTETVNDFSDVVGMAEGGLLSWIDGTYAIHDGTESKIIIDSDIEKHATCTFQIASPLGSTWYAMLRTKRGDPAAFRFEAVENATVSDGVVLGEVGKRAKIGIVATNREPKEINEAELIFVVKCNGKTLPADVVAPNSRNYTIIQNINI